MKLLADHFYTRKRHLAAILAPSGHLFNRWKTFKTGIRKLVQKREISSGVDN